MPDFIQTLSTENPDQTNALDHELDANSSWRFGQFGETAIYSGTPAAEGLDSAWPLNWTQAIDPLVLELDNSGSALGSIDNHSGDCTPHGPVSIRSSRTMPQKPQNGKASSARAKPRQEETLLVAQKHLWGPDTTNVMITDENEQYVHFTVNGTCVGLADQPCGRRCTRLIECMGGPQGIRSVSSDCGWHLPKGWRPMLACETAKHTEEAVPTRASVHRKNRAFCTDCFSSGKYTGTKGRQRSMGKG
jgi:hypothetical protein